MAAKSSDPLRHYFEWLQGQFDGPGIPDEPTLSETVEIRRFPIEVKTLLESLGYDSETVQPQFPIQAGANKVKLDFLVGQGPSAWALELKSPDQQCENSRFVDQLQDYMYRTKTPIGVLFNGHHAAIYVNPAHDALKRSVADRADDLKERPVAQEDPDDPDGLCSLFSSFRRTTAMPDTVKLARKLIKALPQRSKTGEIRLALQQLLQEPTADLALMISASPELASLGATPEIVMAEWPFRPDDSGGGGDSLASQVKRLIVEVCRQSGYDALAQRGIKGLRLRTDGDLSKGFYPIPHGPGVPPGLCVGPLSGPVAKRIIVDLKRLIAQPSK